MFVTFCLFLSLPGIDRDYENVRSGVYVVIYEIQEEEKKSNQFPFDSDICSVYVYISLYMCI